MNAESGRDTSSQSKDRQPPSIETDVLRDLLKQLSELFEYASHYISATTDAAKLSARQAAIRVLVEVGFMLAAASLVVSALTLLFIGVAGGFAEWFDGRVWLGDLLAGLLMLTLVGGAVWVRVARLKRTSHQRTVQSYEQRKLRQQERFGRDVAAQAATARAKD
jgi:phosphotransferase system  glucose/maltose/N-acetylglucosamine-specific IIC component